MSIFSRRQYRELKGSQPFLCIAHLERGGVRKIVMHVEDDISLTTIRQKEILRFAASEIQNIWIGSKTCEFQSPVSPDTCMTIAAGSWRIALEFPTFHHRAIFLNSIRSLFKDHNIDIPEDG